MSTYESNRIIAPVLFYSLLKIVLKCFYFGTQDLLIILVNLNSKANLKLFEFKMASLEELKNVLKDTLDKRGVLAKVKVSFFKYFINL